MGRTISEETYQRIQRLQAEDRLCQHGNCSGRSQFLTIEDWTTMEGWTGEKLRTTGLCRRHMNQLMRSLEAHGVLYQNGGELLGTYKMQRREHGEAAREAALRQAQEVL